jgi:hypothetical protein
VAKQRSAANMKTIPLFLLTCLSPLLFGADLIDYDASITFAQERSDEKISKEKAIFCLGPEQVEELYSNDGKEDKKIARFARSFDSVTTRTVGNLLSSINVLVSNASYEVCVYRSDNKKLLVRVTGEGSELHMSQFSLRAGDLVIIRRIEQ